MKTTGGRPRRRAGGGAAAGGGVMTAEAHRSRMFLTTSVCFSAAENCRAKLSSASPKRPAWEIGESRKRCLSDSLISWTTNVDI